MPATTPPTTTSLDQLDTGDIVGFETERIQLGEETLTVAIADTPQLRSRGLMGVEDFGDVDGMLFVYELPSNGSFWMRDTLVPLDIAFFDQEGRLVQVLTMVPCPESFADSECERYRPNGTYMSALERPAGTMLDLPADAVLIRG